MAINKYPPFGAHLGASQITETENVDESELSIGDFNYQFLRSKTKECSVAYQDCAWGIQVHDDLIIDSVTFRVADEIEPEYVPAQTPADGEPIDPTKPLIKLSCCKIQKVILSLVIEGKGNPDFKIGDEAYPQLECAIGDFNLTPIVDAVVQGIQAFNSEARFKVIRYHTNESNDQWMTFSTEFKVTSTNPTRPTSYVLPFINLYLNSELNGEIPCESDYGNICKSYEITWELKDTGYARTTGLVKLHPMI